MKARIKHVGAEAKRPGETAVTKQCYRLRDGEESILRQILICEENAFVPF